MEQLLLIDDFGVTNASITGRTDVLGSSAYFVNNAVRFLLKQWVKLFSLNGWISTSRRSLVIFYVLYDVFVEFICNLTTRIMLIENLFILIYFH
jgi:hypothetical protein